jgi:uncharacterized repeat protein (TIGR03943 family)
VNRGDSGVTAALIGLTAILIGATDALTRYLRPNMARWLVLAGSVVLVLGVVTLAIPKVISRRSDAANDTSTSGPGSRDSGSHYGPWVSRVGWMLLLPVLIAVVIDPGALGSYTIAQQSASRSPVGAEVDLEALLRSRSFAGQPVELSLLQLSQAVYAGEHLDILEETPLVLQGFVVHDERLADGFLLARLVIGCCAGDAIPIVVAVDGDPLANLPDDAWIRAEVRFDQARTTTAGEGTEDMPAVDAVVDLVDFERIEPPTEPYLYPW